MTARIFFDREEHADKVAENLAVEKACEISITSDREEIEVALKQENIPRTSYSIAEVEGPVDRSFL